MGGRAADRFGHERAAQRLADTAGPLAATLGPLRPAVLGVRRAQARAPWNPAASGRPPCWRNRAGARHGPTARPSGHVPHPPPAGPGPVKTARFAEGEARLRDLGARIAQHPHADPSLRLHIRCMLARAVACQERWREAGHEYDAVAARRTRELGPDHPDTLETHKYLTVARALAPAGRRLPPGRDPLGELRRIARQQADRHGHDRPAGRDTHQWYAALAERAGRR
ncbi:hypothetical protein QQY24_02290 [Streptomyces sp. TG1A-8]|uniref:hypothetical protein n=1 Tax=Streptomyces sp. TG1A-8 TaxID=3051385 RepID=UPI00265C0052|nr:hypothetical protein [Streptomyces sp. TG1A-8]MDO0924295.1 hypothetical protein [Streptomyces sp. TG1A-8]